jgi:hypothetical protein
LDSPKVLEAVPDFDKSPNILMQPFRKVEAAPEKDAARLSFIALSGK